MQCRVIGQHKHIGYGPHEVRGIFEMKKQVLMIGVGAGDKLMKVVIHFFCFLSVLHRVFS